MQCQEQTFVSHCDLSDESVRPAARAACERLGFDDAESFGTVQWLQDPNSYETRYSILYACQEANE